MNKRQEPRLRFKGFTGAWQEKTIFELAQDNKLNNGVFNDKNKAGSGYKLINVLDMYLENGIDENTLQLLDLSHDEFLRNKVNYGDVFFTRSSLVKEGIAYSNTYLGSSNDVTYDGHLIKLTPNKNLVSPIFLNYELKTAAVRRQFIIGGKTTTMTTIGQQEIGESVVMLPLLPEQTHLGLFFRRLDSQIAESRAVLEKSRQLKKAMLVKMFPANGEKMPKIRFKGFEGEWKITTLGNLMHVTSVKRIHQSDWTSDGIRFLRARDIVAFNKGEKIEEPLYISEKKYTEYSEISGKVKIGDLLVTGVGTIGVPYLIENDEPVYFKDGNVIWFQNENKVDGLFFYYSFLNNFIQDFIIETAGIGTVGTYTIDTGKKTPIFLPPTEYEQTAIGLFFRQLDETIALQSAEVEKLNQLKKGLLAAMLV